MNKRCLICAQKVKDNTDYHLKCTQALFGTPKVPLLAYEEDELAALAKKAVKNRVTVPGVQAKLSLEIKEKAEKASKLTIVGLWGSFILKPPSPTWPQLPENEHCTLMMAECADIETVPYGLIRLKSGALSFITRRIDRTQEGKKRAMEDMCQLTERMTEDKYKGSHEHIAKVIKRCSANPLFDLVRFFDRVFFCYITGNVDMHLKNFSLFKDKEIGWKLAPAYDLLSTRLVIPESKDPDELALTLNGKKSNFSLNTFKKFGQNIGLNTKQIDNIFEKYESRINDFIEVVGQSFLNNNMQENYTLLLEQRAKNLFS